MRLGQLARKLEVRPIDIVEFLATQNIHLEEGANTKIEDSAATLALQRFAPHLHLADVPDVDMQSVETSTPSDNVMIPPIPDETSGNAEMENEDKSGQPDIIKAPKIELSGLKVLGKIDLPEPKKKQPDTSSENMQGETNKEVRQERRNQNVKRQSRTVKNPIALQREREAAEAKRKREEELKLQKEKRTQNYLKKVKTHQPTKAARLIKEKTEEISQAQLEEPPKTWWGKFLKWLTT